MQQSHQTTRPVILASQSPRRKELLGKMGVKFKVVPSHFDEHLDHSRHVEEVAVELALGKAREVARKYPSAIVIGADTIVLIDDEQLGKPKDRAEAERTLRRLAGRMNLVSTGLAVLCNELKLEITEVDTARVFFKPVDNGMLTAYLDSGDWHDKAGSYGIQSGAAPLVDHLEGRYDSVLGLPTVSLAAILRSLGVPCRALKLAVPVPVRQMP